MVTRNQERLEVTMMRDWEMSLEVGVDLSVLTRLILARPAGEERYSEREREGELGGVADLTLYD